MTEMFPIEEVFFAALDKATPEERAAYLDAACAGRPELRAKVERLLAAMPKVGAFLEPNSAAVTGPHVAVDPDANEPPRPPEAVGAVIAGRYKLLQQIGEGGMGTVWMADQTEPVKRRIAVKLIRAERGQSRTILSRFEAERQAIALMDHPHIAKLLDAGTTNDGQPFFVMELVKGVPLNEFCDAHRLGIPERLNLFVQVCEAVQHAHQKGIIHRDLKPGNVLVESHDGKPVPKVIDFGLAKAASGLPLTEHTLFTAFGSVMGTPLYMAPEQASFNAADVDTRADIYALGVILYELLTGTTPLPRESVRAAALDELLRLIREQEAPTPSSRLSSPGNPPSIAANRQTEPAKLGRFVKGELDWIVLKALAKERDRRYETASGLAKDVERFLNHEPVTAGPPTAAYRLRKFARRNRPQVVAAGLVLAALLAGIAGTTWGLVRAERALERTAEEERKVRGLLAESEENRRATELRLASATIDLDLSFNGSETNTCLLRLARSLRSLPADARSLREFVTMAMIARGQELAPLVQPFRTTGEDVEEPQLTRNGLTMLTTDGISQLWDTRTGRLRAVLREGAETTQHAVLSEDGRVVCTVAPEGVARFWDVPTSRLTARTEPLDPAFGEERGEDGEDDWFRFSQDGRRLVSVLRAGKLGESWEISLWDTATGRRLARLPRFGGSGKGAPAPVAVAFSPDGRRLATAWATEPVRVWSADTGALVRALDAVKMQNAQAVVFTPSGHLVVATDGVVAQWWDADSGRVDTVVGYPNSSEVRQVVEIQAVSENVIALGLAEDMWMTSGMHDRMIITFPASDNVPCRIDEEILAVGTRVRDLRRHRDLHPPAGRTYHPTLSRFAIEGRWLPEDSCHLVDLTVDKQVSRGWSSTPTHVPGIGFVMLNKLFTHSLLDDQRRVYVPAWIPTPGRLPPDDLVILWAQIISRGELGPDDEFVQWDEATWNKKRQELAARPIPFPDFPFPGRVATDSLYWLRVEFKRHISKENGWALVRKAEAVGEKDEAAHWHEVMKKRFGEQLPLPKVEP